MIVCQSAADGQFPNVTASHLKAAGTCRGCLTLISQRLVALGLFDFSPVYKTLIIVIQHNSAVHWAAMNRYNEVS